VYLLPLPTIVPNWEKVSMINENALLAKSHKGQGTEENNIGVINERQATKKTNIFPNDGMHLIAEKTGSR
jgi:hypothetical protein